MKYSDGARFVDFEVFNLVAMPFDFYTDQSNLACSILLFVQSVGRRACQRRWLISTTSSKTARPFTIEYPESSCHSARESCFYAIRSIRISRSIVFRLPKS